MCSNWNLIGWKCVVFEIVQVNNITLMSNLLFDRLIKACNVVVCCAVAFFTNWLHQRGQYKLGVSEELMVKFQLLDLPSINETITAKIVVVSLQSRQLHLCSMSDQGIIDPTRKETFAKEPKFAKLLRELKSTPAWYY